MNNRGYTLVELMIYLVVASIIAVLAMDLIRGATKSYMHEKGVSEMQSSGRDIASIMSRDIVNLGFRTYMHRIGTVDVLDTVRRVRRFAAYGTADSLLDQRASLLYIPGSGFNVNFDKLIFKELILDPPGTDAVRVDSIIYSVSGGVLSRSVSNALIDVAGTLTSPSAATGAMQPAPGGTTTPEVTTIAENVEALKFEFSVDNLTWTSSARPIGGWSAVRAVRFNVVVRTDKETTTPGRRTFALGGYTYTAPTDKYLRRQYQETIQVVNNGL